MNISDTKLIINDLRLRAFIGVSDQEQVAGNDYSVSLTLNYQAYAAMTADNISRAVNYGTIVKTVKEVLAEPCRLLEHAAYELAKRIDHDFPTISAGEVTISKLAPPVPAELHDAAFSLTWHRGN